MHCVDADRTVLAAEIVFVIREEMAQTLGDVVYRRLMLGLDAGQGRGLYDAIAAIAAAELGWDDQERQAQLDALVSHSDSLLIR